MEVKVKRISFIILLSEKKSHNVENKLHIKANGVKKTTAERQMKPHAAKTCGSCSYSLLVFIARGRGVLSHPGGHIGSFSGPCVNLRRFAEACCLKGRSV